MIIFGFNDFVCFVWRVGFICWNWRNNTGTITIGGLGIVFETDTDENIFRSNAESDLWQLNLDNKVMDPAIQAQINQLATKTYSQASTDYDNFFTQYGTHYCDVVVVGGLAKMDTVVQGDTNAFRFQLSVVLDGKMSGAMSFEGRIDFELGISTMSEVSTLSSQSVVYGGDPYVAGWITVQDQPDVAKQMFSAWKKSLAANPVVVRYRLVSMDLLFPSGSQSEACQAIAKKMGSTTFCSTTEVQDVALPPPPAPESSK